MYMKRQPLGSMLEAWYGRERAQAEKLRFLPAARSLGEIAQSIVKKAVPPDILDFFLVRDSWAEIAGPEMAKRCFPLKLEGGRLTVEIAHPAWLAHFRAPQVKKPVLERIEKILGKKSCRDISFVPAGSQLPGKRED